MKTPWTKEKAKVYGAKYYQENKWRWERTVPRNIPKEYSMWNSAKARARRSGQECTIKLEDIVIPTHCPVFDIPMVSPSIDRFDNSKGYTKENIRIISKRANVLKSNATTEELQQIIRYMQG